MRRAAAILSFIMVFFSTPTHAQVEYYCNARMLEDLPGLIEGSANAIRADLEDDDPDDALEFIGQLIANLSNIRATCAQHIINPQAMQADDVSNALYLAAGTYLVRLVSPDEIIVRLQSTMQSPCKETVLFDVDDDEATESIWALYTASEECTVFLSVFTIGDDWKVTFDRLEHTQ